jgi:hypothetical protein
MTFLDLISFGYVFSMGWMPINNDSFVKDPAFNDYCTTPMFSDLSFRINFENLYVGGGIKTIIVPLALTNYLPIKEDYDIEVGYKLRVYEKCGKNFYAEPRFVHQCQHLIAACTGDLPLHEDRARNEFAVKFSFDDTIGKINKNLSLDIGYLPYSSQSLTDYHVDYNSSKPIINDVNCYYRNKNLLLLMVNVEVDYKNFYLNLNARNVIGDNYSLSEEVGYKKEFKRVNIGVAFKNENKRYYSLNGDLDNRSWQDKGKQEVFVRFSK